MKTFHQFGWVVAAILALFLVFLMAAGFQDSTTKIGVVDLAKLLDSSEMSKDSTSSLTAAQKVREDMLGFLDTYKVASAEQVIKLKNLSLKAKLSEPEKTELETLKADIMRTDQKYKELLQKANPTPDEQSLLTDYASRARSNQATVQRLWEEFKKELDDKLRLESQAVLDKARLSIQEVSKAGGYTAVFDQRIAPYGTNDLTEAALKAMNAKK